jgi:hypothetical protein
MNYRTGQERLPDSLLDQTAVHDLYHEKRPRELAANQYMARNPNGRNCSRCGDTVPAPEDIRATVCWRCTYLLAELWRRGYWADKQKPARPCPDCGTALKPRQRVCVDCRKKRRRTAKRENARKRRAAVDS